MEIEILLAAVILIAMIFLATVDLAFSHLSDVGLRDSIERDFERFVSLAADFEFAALAEEHASFGADVLGAAVDAERI